MSCTHGGWPMRLAVNTRCPFCGNIVTASPTPVTCGEAGSALTLEAPRKIVPGVSRDSNARAVPSSPVQRPGHTIAGGDATTPPAPIAASVLVPGSGASPARRPSAPGGQSGTDAAPIASGVGAVVPGASSSSARGTLSPTRATPDALSLLDLIDTTPMARASDPDTAHQAAWAAHNTDHRAVYIAILAAVHEHGPLTDYHLSLHVARRTGIPILRTSVGKRRGELRDMGLMVDSGHRAKTDTNSTAIRWANTPAGEHELLARSTAA